MVEPAASADRLRASEPRDRVVEFFERLDAAHMALVDDFYAPDCRFVDPLGEHRGVEAVRAYYDRLYRDVHEIAFEFEPIFGERLEGDAGETLAAPWTMRVRAKLGGGRLIEVRGISRIRFDGAGKAAFHEDSFDLGAFVYENVPLLSWMVRFVKRKLAG